MNTNIKLTKAQIAILQVARDYGDALAETSYRQMAGGARRRMVFLLRDQGLLTYAAPYKITKERLVALAAAAPKRGEG